MFRYFFAALAAFAMSANFAIAAVDVNQADLAALDGIKGIGPAMSKAILEERRKSGAFRDWADFQNRVKGVGEKNSSKLSESGLTIDGKAKWDAPKPKPKMSISWTNPNERNAPGTSRQVDAKPIPGMRKNALPVADKEASE